MKISKLINYSIDICPIGQGTTMVAFNVVDNHITLGNYILSLCVYIYIYIYIAKKLYNKWQLLKSSVVV
jgi:hypothetical protein